MSSHRDWRARRRTEDPPAWLPEQEAEAFRSWITENLGENLSNPTLNSLESAYHQLKAERDIRAEAASWLTERALHNVFAETTTRIIYFLIALGKEASKPKPRKSEHVRGQPLGITDTHSPLLDT